MSMAPNGQVIVAIDDERGIQQVVRLTLTERGYRVLTASDAVSGLQLIEKHRPDLVLLDIVMPSASGLDVLARIRERSNVPVILLTGMRGEADTVRGLELGADDYLAKPFNIDELQARVRAVLRRARPTEAGHGLVCSGDLEIDLEQRQVRRGAEVVKLTRTEWNLLRCLAANPGKVMMNSELLREVWGPEYVGDLEYLRVWVSRLRAKLEQNAAEPGVIMTFQGMGYMLSAQAPVEPEAVPAAAS